MMRANFITGIQKNVQVLVQGVQYFVALTVITGTSQANIQKNLLDCTLQAELMRLLSCRAFVQVVAIGFGSTEAQSSVTISQENR